MAQSQTQSHYGQQGRVPPLMRVTPTSAAIAAIQSVQTPAPPPVPHLKSYSMHSLTPYFPGGGIEGRIDPTREIQDVEVVKDEVTARHSVGQFSRFLRQKRQQRAKLWKSYWRHRKQLNQTILRMECEIAVDALSQAAEVDGEDDLPKFQRQIASLPFARYNVGSFNIPPPPPVVIPEPRQVTQMAMSQTVDMQRRIQCGRMIHRER